MRSYLAMTLFGGALAGAALSLPAAAADWFNPHIYSESHGSWTNVEYDDGTCHYKYSYDASDEQTNVNRWGDCSRVSIGPGGQPVRLIAVPAPLIDDD